MAPRCIIISQDQPATTFRTMPRKRRKTKKKVTETERYEVQVGEWDVDFFFHLNQGNRDIFSGVFWEHSHVGFTGELLSPQMKYGNEVRVEVKCEPELDDHWQRNSTVEKYKAIGFFKVPRGSDIIEFNCWIPSRQFQYILTAAAADKIKFASIFGTKMKWRKGKIFNLDMSTFQEEE